MVHRVQRVGVAQLAKVMGVLYLTLGLIFGVCFWLFSVMIPSSRPGGALMGTGLGLGMVVIMPIAYAVMGVVFGALTAWLYNMVAGWIGGVEIDLDPA